MIRGSLRQPPGQRLDLRFHSYLLAMNRSGSAVAVTRAVHDRAVRTARRGRSVRRAERTDIVDPESSGGRLMGDPEFDPLLADQYPRTVTR